MKDTIPLPMKQTTETGSMSRSGKLRTIKDEKRRSHDAKVFFDYEKILESEKNNKINDEDYNSKNCDSNDNNDNDNNNNNKNNNNDNNNHHKNENENIPSLHRNPQLKKKSDSDSKIILCCSSDSLSNKKKTEKRKNSDSVYLQPLVTYDTVCEILSEKRNFFDASKIHGRQQHSDLNSTLNKNIRRNTINEIRKELFGTENILQKNLLPQPISHCIKYNLE